MSNNCMKVVHKHYETQMVKKAFLKIKLNWFEEKIQWRFVLRANLHYKFALKRKTICKLRLAVIGRKEKILQESLANLHYERKITMKYFTCLKYTKTIHIWEGIVSNSIEKYAVLLCLEIKIMEMAAFFQNSQVEWFLIITYAKMLKKRMLKRCFKKLQLFKGKCQVRRNNERLIRLFKQLKYNPESLRRYFEKLFNHAQYKNIKRLRYEIAKKHHENKLKRFSLVKLFLFYERKKSEQKHQQIYLQKITISCLKSWISFKHGKVKKRETTKFAQEFYCNSLKRKCFVGFKRIKERKILMLEYEARKIKKIKEECLFKFKQFFARCKLKKNKEELAGMFFNDCLVKRCFILMVKYVKQQKTKKAREEEIILRLTTIIEAKMKKNSLLALRNYKNHKQQKQNKMKLILEQRSFFLVQKAFKKWVKMLHNKKAKTEKEETSKKHYLNRLLQNTIAQWKKYIEENERYKKLLTKAQEIHLASLLRKGLGIILHSAHEQQKHKQKLVLETKNKQYSIVLNCFKRWRSKALLKQSIGKTDNICVNEFIWNPLCFQQPQIPDYLKLK